MIKTKETWLDIAIRKLKLVFYPLVFLCFAVLMGFGLYLGGRDALVVAIGTPTQARVIGFTDCYIGKKVSPMPIIQFTDLHGNVHTVKQYDYWACPQGYSVNQTISILYLPFAPERIILKQDRLPLGIVFLLYLPLLTLVLIGGVAYSIFVIVRIAKQGRNERDSSQSEDIKESGFSS